MWTRQCMGNEMNARQCMGCIAAACCCCLLGCLLPLPAGLPAAAACWVVCLLALPAWLTAACGAQAAAQTAHGRGGGDQKGQRAKGNHPPSGNATPISLSDTAVTTKTQPPTAPSPLPDSDNPPQNAPPLLGPPGRKTVLGSYRA